MTELILEIGIGVLFIMLSIVGFFLKKAFKDLDDLKEKQTNAKVLEREVENMDKHVEKLETTIYQFLR